MRANTVMLRLASAASSRSMVSRAGQRLERVMRPSCAMAVVLASPAAILAPLLFGREEWPEEACQARRAAGSRHAGPGEGRQVPPPRRRRNELDRDHAERGAGCADPI